MSTCSECQKDAPYLYIERLICRECFQKAGGTLNVGQWAAEMNYSHPNPERAWND